MKRFALALLLLLALGGVATPAAAMSLDQAVAQVRQQTGGRILAAETVTVNGQRMYRIKVLTPDHKVRIILIRAD